MKEKLMIKAFVSVLILLNVTICSETIFGAGKRNQKDLWQTVAERQIRSKGPRSLFPEKYQTFTLNSSLLLDSISGMPLQFGETADGKNVVLDIPMPDGTISKFRVEETQVLASHLAKEFPAWKTFQGYGIDDPTATGRFDWTSNGFHGYIFTDRGTVYIDPFQMGDKENYLVYYKHEYGAPAAGDFSCKVGESLADELAPFAADKPEAPAFAYGTALRTYRIAVATTGQWARSTTTSTDPQAVRTAALAAITTSVNRLDGIFIREMAVTFQLVNPPITDNAKNIIFDDPANQPFNNTDQDAQLNINQTTLDARIGAPNYDIGHLYGTGGGGIAATPSVCSGQKAQGYSARNGQQGDPFTVDYVAHEVGHQFGANHTYNNRDNGGACTTRSNTSAFEVASGSTIMSYVGICNLRNLQQYVDTGTPSFHIRSLTEITANLQDNSEGSGGSCGNPAGTNGIPTVNAGANFTIPRLTPFTLTATGNDPDAADVPNLLYSWEEYDLAPSGSGEVGTPAGTYDVDTDGVLRPLFRAYSPVASNSRTFPSLAYILNPANNAPAGSNNPPLTFQGANPTGVFGSGCAPQTDCAVGENLPSAARTMNFRVAIRDRRGGIADAGMTVTTVAATGPFQVTTQNTAPTAWAVGSTQTVTWDVAGTAAAPIGAANVKISLSTDGGQTFPITLLASTPNDGTEPVTVPNNPTNQARIKVEAVGNIFFDISNADFQITGAGPTPTPAATPTPVPAGIGIGDAAGREPGGAAPGQNGPFATTTFDFVVTRTGNLNTVSTVHYQTVDGTATVADHDYEPASGDLRFGVGETTKDVFVVIDGDDKVEPDESFTVHLSVPGNANIVDADGLGTILTDDAPAFEGDINRIIVGFPGEGDGDVNVGDQVQYQRFLRGIDCPGVTSFEQQKLDAGPRATRGDGLLGSSDGTAIDAYARHDSSTDFDPNTAGWQPTPAGGPMIITNLGCTAPSTPIRMAEAFQESPETSAARIMQIMPISGANGSEVTVDIEMNALGNEAGTQYSLRFDPSVMAISSVSGVDANPDITVGADAPKGTTLNVNAENAANGVIGIVENFVGAAQSMKPLHSGTKSIAHVRFRIRADVEIGDAWIVFDDSVVNRITVDANGLPLVANYNQAGNSDFVGP